MNENSGEFVSSKRNIDVAQDRKTCGNIIRFLDMASEVIDMDKATIRQLLCKHLAYIDEIERLRQLCDAARRLLLAATGPEDGPESWRKTRQRWINKIAETRNCIECGNELHDVESDICDLCQLDGLQARDAAQICRCNRRPDEVELCAVDADETRGTTTCARCGNVIVREP